MRIVLILLMAAILLSSMAVIGNKPVSNVVNAAELLPPTQATEGQLQVVDKDGKPIGQCPLKHTDVTADVSGFVARVDVTQEFVNPLGEKIEAVYVFPLPQDAAVDRMEMTVGERTIRGEIKRREEAKQIYEQAKQQGQVASLLDQERPNIFTQSVANILPGEKVLIKISYVNTLKYENGQYEFVFPMVVGPRYIPGKPAGVAGQIPVKGTDQVPDAENITPPITPEGTRAGHDISVEVKLHPGMPVSDIKSVLHQIEIQKEDKSDVTVRLLDRATIPNKDFILRYKIAGDTVRTGLLPNTRSAKDGYFSLIIVPPAVPKATQITPKEMIFVIDSSGSQMGWPIEKSKETMKLCVEQMNPNDTFQMLAFSNDVISLFDKPQTNTPENRTLAQEFLSTRLGGGGTEMLKAVMAALTPPADPKRLRIVCFMTDGYVGNDMQIMAEIKKNIGGARLFSFGIGNGANRFLLDGMADMGRGAVEYVTLAEKGDEAAKKFHERISKPVLTDISIDWGGLPVSDTYPEQILDLFSNQPVILKGRYHAPAQGVITVKGKLGGKPWSEQVQVNLPNESDENQALPSLWARARIEELMKKDYQGIQHGNIDTKLEEDITQVALEYSLMSQYTSFVAVEEKVVTEGGQPKKITVPVEMPEGVSYEGIFGKDKVCYDVSGGSFARRSPSAKVAQSLAAPASPSTYAAGGVPTLGTFADMEVQKPEGEYKLDAGSKITPELAALIRKVGKNNGYAQSGPIEVRKGRVKIAITLTDWSDANLAKLKQLGLSITASSKGLNKVIGGAPLWVLEDIAKLGFVVRIEPVKGK